METPEQLFQELIQKITLATKSKICDPQLVGDFYLSVKLIERNPKLFSLNPSYLPCFQSACERLVKIAEEGHYVEFIGKHFIGRLIDVLKKAGHYDTLKQLKKWIIKEVPHGRYEDLRKPYLHERETLNFKSFFMPEEHCRYQSLNQQHNKNISFIQDNPGPHAIKSPLKAIIDYWRVLRLLYFCKQIFSPY